MGSGKGQFRRALTFLASAVVAVLLLAFGASATAARVTIRQPRHDWLFTVLPNRHNPKKTPKYAQTFQAPRRQTTLTKVATWVDVPRGSAAVVRIYRVRDNQFPGVLLATQKLKADRNSSSSYATGKLDRPVPMKGGKKYAFSISSVGGSSHFWFAGGYRNPYQDGSAYCFCKKIGSGTRQPQWWRLHKGAGNLDLAFRLTFHK